MYFYIALVVWIGSIWFSFANGRRKLPLTIMLLGILDLVAIYQFAIGAVGVAILAGLSVVMLLSLKIDSLRK